MNADCWSHPDLEVRSSLIAGQGLFATAAIPAGTVVATLGGRLVSGRDWRLPELRERYGEHWIPLLRQRL